MQFKISALFYLSSNDSLSCKRAQIRCPLFPDESFAFGIVVYLIQVIGLFDSVQGLLSTRTLATSTLASEFAALLGSVKIL